MDIPTEDVTGRWFKYRNDVIVYILKREVLLDGYVCLINNATHPSFIYSYHWKDLEPYEC